jgi:uncharacterized protein YbaP (TraB family)
MFRLLCVVAFVASVHFSYAQNSARPNYQLLWKITGKGLKKPSYLFGTMHVRDNKAFDFSDSVLFALTRCEAFAAEVHPDSMVNTVMAGFLHGDQRTDHFRKHLSDDEYVAFDSLMQLRMGVPLTQFKSPSDASYFMLQQFEKKDKDTFLDIWLFNIARNDGKMILGLENIEEQLAMMDKDMPGQIAKMKEYLTNDKGETKKWFELMFETYYAGDINAIRKISLDASTPAYYESMIRKRNAQMAKRIANEIPKRSTFIAVGAAHLPGEEGLVHLLRQQGFKVTMVKATFTGVAATFNASKGIPKWVNFSNAEGGYTLDLPTKPIAMPMPNTPITFQAAFDAGTFSIFMATHFPFGGEYAKRTDELLDLMTDSFGQRGDVQSKKSIEIGGRKGREMDVKMNEQFFRLRVIAGEKMVYMLMVGPSEAIANGDNASRFFSSFTMTPVNATSSWEEYVNEQGAFAVRMPGKVSTQLVTPEDPEIGKKYKLYLSYATDVETSAGFLIRYNDFIPGYISEDDSVYMQNTLDNMLTNMEGTNVKTQKTEHQGFPAVRFGFDGKNSLRAEGLMTMRGNRFYIALTTRAGGTVNERIEPFLQSLRFIPYKRTEMRSLNFPNGVKMKVPAAFETDSSLFVDGKESARYAFLDVNSGILFILQQEQLDRYSEVKDAATYFKNVKEGLELENYSVTKENPFVQGKTIGHDFWLKSTATNAVRRIRMLVSGDQVSTLWTYLPADYEKSNVPEEILNSLSLNVNSKWSLFADKTDALLTDLTSPDTVRYTEARAAIPGHEFEKADLPKIYKLLSRAYPDDGEKFRTIRKNLFAVLKEVHDEKTAAFIKQVYPTLPDTTTLRDNALSVLGALKTETDVRAMVDMIREDKSGRLFDGYLVLQGFYDSLALVNVALPDLFDLEKRFDEIRNLMNLTKTALDSGVLTGSVKEKAIRQSIAIGARIAQEPKLDEEDPQFYDQQNTQWRLASLMTSLPFTNEVKDILLKLHQLHDRDIMTITSVHLLKNKVVVPGADLDKVASDRSYRIQFYRDLKAIGEQDRINKKYRTSVALAESCVQEYLEYMDEWPDTLVMHSVKTMMFKGEKAQFIVFKYKYEEDDTWYLAASGPFNEKSKKQLPEGELTTSFYEATSTEEEVNALLRKYLEENGATLVGK